jgi:hypothetical protein
VRRMLIPVRMLQTRMPHRVGGIHSGLFR